MNLEQRLTEPKEENATVDYALFNLVKEVNEALTNQCVIKYIKLIHGFIQEYVIPYGLSYNQTLVLLKLIYPLMPFLAEDLYAKLSKSKYSIINEDWPN